MVVFILGLLVKWHILSDIADKGHYAILGSDSGWGSWLSMKGIVSKLLNMVIGGELTLTAGDFGLNGIPFNAEATGIAHVSGVLLIMLALILGDAMIAKIRSYRRNIYFEGISQSTGVDLRFLFWRPQLERFLSTPVEKHHDFAIDCVKEVHQKLLEQQQAIMSLDDSNAVQLERYLGPTVHALRRIGAQWANGTSQGDS